DPQVGNLGKQRGNCFGKTIREIVLLGIAGKVLQRQYSDRLDLPLPRDRLGLMRPVPEDCYGRNHTDHSHQRVDQSPTTSVAVTYSKIGGKYRPAQPINRLERGGCLGCPSPCARVDCASLLRRPGSSQADRGDKTVTPASYRLNKSRIAGRVAQSLAKLADCGADAALEVDEGV